MLTGNSHSRNGVFDSSTVKNAGVVTVWWANYAMLGTRFGLNEIKRESHRHVSGRTTLTAEL